MEIMYSNKSNDILKNKGFVGICGDKKDLVNMGVDFIGIDYNDEWSVKRFLNGLKFKISDNILELFNEFEINNSLFKRKIRDLSKGEFKLILLVYVLLNKKEVIILDYFDKGLSNKLKKRIISFLKTKYDGKVIVISNDLIFLNMLVKDLMVFIDGKLVFNDNINNVYRSNLKLDYPTIIKFIELANRSNAKLHYVVDNKELLKDIYRSVV